MEPDRDLEQYLIDCAFRNEKTKRLYDLLLTHDLPNWALVSGCIFQPVWNHLTGQNPSHGIRDYDVFYFDSDLSYEAEDIEIKRLNELTASLDIPVELRNQARVHIWYQKHFGTQTNYQPLTNMLEGIERFLMPCCAVGLYPDDQGRPRVHAPFGLRDLFDMVIRPNTKSQGIQPENYYQKANRWKDCWPQVQVLQYDLGI